MRTRIEQVIVCAPPHHWGKWPVSEDEDFDAIRAERRVDTYQRGDVTLEVVSRYYPIYSAYPRSGDKRLPPGQGFQWINNTVLPSERVLVQMLADLQELSRECRVLVWEHTHHCFPPVAEHLPKLFPLKVITFADDCPGSSDIKTFPVCRWFDALYFQMYIFDDEKGSLTAAEYYRRGLPYCRFSPSTVSAGLEAQMQDGGWTVETKIGEIIGCRPFPIDLIFCGAWGAGRRRALLEGLAARKEQSRLAIRMFGVDLPDGTLEPRDPPHPKGLAYPLAEKYRDALMGLNVPVSSIFNCRLMDLWMTGTVQVLHDRHRELEAFGFLPDRHYLPFDGTPDDLLRVVEEAAKNRGHLGTIATNAWRQAQDFMKFHGRKQAFTDIYFDHLARLV